MHERDTATWSKNPCSRGGDWRSTKITNEVAGRQSCCAAHTYQARRTRVTSMTWPAQWISEKWSQVAPWRCKSTNVGDGGGVGRLTKDRSRSPARRSLSQAAKSWQVVLPLRARCQVLTARRNTSRWDRSMKHVRVAPTSTEEKK